MKLTYHNTSDLSPSFLRSCFPLMSDALQQTNSNFQTFLQKPIIYPFKVLDLPFAIIKCKSSTSRDKWNIFVEFKTKKNRYCN